MSLYSDLNPFDPSRPKPLLLDGEAVYGSLFNLLNTKRGEVLFDLEFGLDLEDELFELGDEAAALTVLDRVVEQVQINEPRTIILYNKTTLKPEIDRNTFFLDLYFEIIGHEGQTFNFSGRLER